MSTDLTLDHLTLRISVSSEALQNALRFRIVSEGCFGVVCRVPCDGVLCAAKNQWFDDNDVYKVKYFQQECLLHSKLRHPNIVRMLGVCYHDSNPPGQPIKIMELLEINLSSVMHLIPMYVKLSLMQDVSRGLDYLHTHDPPIVHSSLTIGIILLTTNLVAKIGGFTFAVEMSPEAERLPTAYFTGDEVLKSSLYCGPPFDIYSFGWLICVVIHGQQCTGTHKYLYGAGKPLVVHTINIGQYEYFVHLIEDSSLKKLVSDCMNDDPDLRPSASLISKMIADVIKDHHAEDSGVKMAYVQAMKEGVAESRDLQVLLVGPENTGKTCLISSFLGEEFVEGQNSTKGADVDVCKIYCKEWTRISHFDKTDHLQYQFASQCKYDAIKKMSPNVIAQTSVAIEEDETTSVADVQAPQTKVSSDVDSHSMKEIVQNSSSKTTQYDPESLNVTLWDFAGQTIFHNTHSVFISEEGVPIITFNASVELTNEVTPRVTSPPLQEASTSISSIHYWLQVVDSMCSVEGGEGDLSPLLPTALLAGTHIDKLHPDIKEARKIAKKMILPVLEKELREKRYAQHLAGSGKGLVAALEQFCFFISNKFRDEEIDRLKSSAVKAAASLRKKQPIFFLKIERALLSHSEQVISKSTLLEIIAQSTFPLAEDGAEFKAILRYFHNKRTILYFSQVKSLQDLVILSPRWLAKLFSYVITAHTYVTMGSDVDKAWKRLTKHGILQENLLEHMLKKFYSDHPIAVSVSYQQVVDILLCFHLIARVTKEVCFCEEGHPSLPGHGDVFIVPSLVPRDAIKSPPSSERERMIYFVFENGFVPISLLNQLIAECICRNVQRKDRLLWLRHGKVGLQLGGHQKYYISQCEEKKSIQLTITAVGDDVDSSQERMDLIDDVTRLLDDVMMVFMPATKRPNLFVPCPLCPSLHVLLSDVCSGDTIFCPHSNDIALPTGYYGDISPSGLTSAIPHTSTDQVTSPTVEKKLEVFTDYYSKLMSVLPTKTLTSHLVTKRIISFEEEEEIRQAPLQSQSTHLVLRKIASSLQGGLVYSFDELLLIMEQFGNISCVELANEIRLKLLEL